MVKKDEPKFNPLIKTGLLYFVIASFIVLLIAVVLFAFNNYSISMTPQLTGGVDYSNIVIDNLKNTKLFESGQIPLEAGGYIPGFKLEYPLGWNETNEIQMQNIMFKAIAPDGLTSINIETTPYDSATTQDAYDGFYSENGSMVTEFGATILQSSKKSVKLQKDGKDYSLDGYIVTFTAQSQDVDLKFFVHFVVYNNVYYGLTYTSTEQDFDTYLTDAQLASDAFTIVDN